MKGWGATIAVIGLAIGACVASFALLGNDPMLPMEAVVGAIVVAWMAAVLRDVWAGHRLGRELARMSRPVLIAGTPCSLVEGGGGLACVVGGLRPRTYVGGELLARLTSDELEAVVLHEDYHRRTLAPLRGAAIRAWVRVLGRSTRIRDVLVAREADLERQADRYAMERGVSRGSIARALLKTDTTAFGMAFGMAFADHGEARIRALAGSDPHGPGPWRGSPMPFEWLPLVSLVAIWIGCHLPQ